jgi:hypothetical protein
MATHDGCSLGGEFSFRFCVAHCVGRLLGVESGSSDLSKPTAAQAGNDAVQITNLEWVRSASGPDLGGVDALHWRACQQRLWVRAPLSGVFAKVPELLFVEVGDDDLDRKRYRLLSSPLWYRPA